MSGVEVERKWLVPEPAADALAAPSERIEQGYLTIGADGAETRVRRRGERCFLTVKSGSGMSRSEREIELRAEQFEALWPATEGRRAREAAAPVPTARMATRSSSMSTKVNWPV